MFGLCRCYKNYLQFLNFYRGPSDELNEVEEELAGKKNAEDIGYFPTYLLKPHHVNSYLTLEMLKEELQ